MIACESEERLRQFLEETLDHTAASQVGTHLEECSDCQQVLEELLQQTAPAALVRRHRSAAETPSAGGQEFLGRLLQSPFTATNAGSQPTQEYPATASLQFLAVTERRGEPGAGLSGYDLLEEIGRGGMGVVYKARHLGLNRLVALKMLHGDCRVRPQLRERFHDEAEAIARLQHPNIVQVYEVGESVRGPYCSLELVEGGSLARNLDGTPQPAAEAAHFIEILARAIHYAHQHNIVHRDLKPANVLLASGVSNDPGSLPGSLLTPLASSTPKITDFGLAKWLDREQSLTQSGAILGTPSYMPPEQARGHHEGVGPAADVYSLGAILYELLTGRPPFKAESTVETTLQVLHREPVSPKYLRPNLPRDLETICLKCLQKEPAKRYVSAVALADDLARFVSGRAIQARPVSAINRSVRWCLRNPTIAGLSLALLLAVMAGGLAVTLAWREAVHEADAKDAALILQKAERLRKETALEEAENNLYTYAISLARREWLGNNLERAEDLLHTCPPRLRHWEWHYLARACRPEALITPLQATTPVVFSPDGRHIAAFHVRNVLLWDVKTGQAVKMIGDMPICRALCFSPQGDMLAGIAPSSNPRDQGISAKVWRTDSGEELRHLRQSGPCRGVAFSADGQHLVSLQFDGAYLLRDVKTGEPTRAATLIKDFPPRSAVVFTQDGNHLAFLGKDATLSLYSLATGETLPVFGEHSKSIISLAVSADGRLLAAADGEQMVRLWQQKEGRLLLRWNYHLPGVRQVVFSADGQQLVTFSAARTLKVLDAQSGLPLLDIRARLGSIKRIALSPNGRVLAAACWDGTVRLVPIVSGEQFQELTCPAWTEACCLGSDGRLLVTTTPPGFLSVRDLLTGAEQARMESLMVRGSSLSPDNRLLASISPDNSVRIWDIEHAQLRFTLSHGGAMLPPNDPSAQINRQLLVFSADSQRLAVKLQNTTIVTWDVTSGKEIARFLSKEIAIQELMFGPDGSTLAALCYDKGLKLWDVRTGQEVYRLPAEKRAFTSMAYCSRNDLLSLGDFHGVIRLYRFGTGKELGSLQGHASSVSSLLFSSDGRRLISSSAVDRVGKIWDVDTQRELLALPAGAFLMRFSADGSKLITVGPRSRVEVWTGGPVQP